MSCGLYRDAISARLDNELPASESAALDRHLATCAGCRAWGRQADRLHRQARVSPAQRVPDLTASILAAVNARHPSPGDLLRDRLRMLLAVLAAAQLGLAMPGLLGWTDGHTSLEVASWEAALAVGFFAAVWRPQWAAAQVPLGATFVAVLVLGTLPDLLGGGLSLREEVPHAVAFAGVVVLALLARRHSRTPDAGIPAAVRAGVRAVDPADDEVRAARPGRRAASRRAAGGAASAA